MIVADSDVLIDALQGREPSLARVREALADGSLVTTAVIAFELLSGAGSERVRRKVENLLEGAGTPIGMADYLIAGICLARSAKLLTRNTADFDRVSGLDLAELTP